jgi:plasmid stabilization system protein ParE
LSFGKDLIMVEKKRLFVEYSLSSLDSASQIVAYLRRRFSEKEVKKFFQLLNDFEKIVGIFPTLYPESFTKKMRKAVLSRALSVYYTVRKNRVNVVAIIDNRWEQSRRLK